MKGIKIFVVALLFGIVIFLVLNIKRRMVQLTCKELGDFKATKGTEMLGMDKDNDEGWYCCPPKLDKNSKNCIYYGE